LKNGRTKDRAGNGIRSVKGIRTARHGAVMMEYVIVAVLIAAACAYAVLALSRTLMRGWGVSVRATVSDTQAAAEKAQKAGVMAGKDAKVVDEHNKLFSDRD